MNFQAIRPVRESTIERHLINRVIHLGGLAYKWVSPGHRGVPDRLVFLPGGVVFAVECKAPGKGLTPLQHYTRERLTALGFRVFVAASKTDVDDILGVAER
ncbi:hypothetical protein CCP4SC76_7600004 [Gammaproteobacteria bacterium]